MSPDPDREYSIVAGRTYCRWCRMIEVRDNKEPAVCTSCLPKVERAHIRHWAQVKRLHTAYERCPDLWPSVSLLIQMIDHVEAIANLERREAVMNEPSIFPLLQALYEDLEEKLDMAGAEDPARKMAPDQSRMEVRLRQSIQQLLQGRSYSTEEMEGMTVPEMMRAYGSTLS